MKQAMLLVALLMFTTSVMAQVMSTKKIDLDRVVDSMQTIEITAVKKDGLVIVENAGEWKHNGPSKLCAALGYSLVVNFKLSEVLSGNDLIKQGYEIFVSIVQNGSNSEGYSHTSGAYHFQKFNISDSWWGKRGRYYIIEAVTCAK